MKPIFLLFLSLISISTLHSQYPVTVADLTLKIGAKSEEVLTYGFAAGDKVLLTLDVEEGKTLKEVEVMEYPGNVRFQDYEVQTVAGRAIDMPGKSILQFRFSNTDILKGRVCRVTIKRLPAKAEARVFNTSVRWVEKFDTSWVMVTKEIDHGGEVWQVEKTRKVLESVDTSIVQVLNRTERVHSRTMIQSSNTSEVCFDLPKNLSLPNEKDPYQVSEVVSWAYTITVGEAGQKWFQEANVKAAAKTVTSTVMKLGVVSTGYGALAMLAIEGVSMFTSPPSGENIHYETYTMIGDEKKVLDAGNSVASSKRITDYKQGRYCILLKNDNIMDGINVDLTVVAVVVKHTYKDETYTVTETGPRREKIEVREAKVEVRKAPVMVE
ncbi:MAG: hypothetical protein IPH04_08745 [Saprospirales bacterium]|nr:hypothetical protein [Saprospirales bacterium]